jgi:hypothetical protein
MAAARDATHTGSTLNSCQVTPRVYRRLPGAELRETVMPSHTHRLWARTLEDYWRSC